MCFLSKFAGGVCPSETGLGLGLPAAPVDQLALQRGEEALSDRVVVDIAHRPHGRTHAHLLAALAEGDAGVPS